MDKTKEINRGYLKHIRSVSRLSVGNVGSSHEEPASFFWRFVTVASRVLPAGLKRRLRPAGFSILSGVRFIFVSARRLIYQVLTLALLLVTSIGLGAWLKVYLWVRGSWTAPLNERAIRRIPDFVDQYPLHLYPILLKSFQFAFLEEEVHRLLEEGKRFLEIAIGEAVFSAKIFPRDAEVVGLDLSPYSLLKAVQMPHVKQAVICDCLRPPISGGHFDVILANNFLHHVTMKGQTLANWSRVAPKLILNEDTPYWASGWAMPFMLKNLGFRETAQRVADQIERHALQHLLPKEGVDLFVRKDYEVLESSSYLSERTFFLCSVYSLIMHCQGPPTPPRLKGLFLSKYMRWLTIPLTTEIARMLIQYDQFQDRSRDAIVSYLCESRQSLQPRTQNYLMCPRCGGELTETDRCKGCQKQYSRKDQMLFLLPEEMDYIEKEYNSEAAMLIPGEHL
jgi:hypothetical protein